MDAGQTSALARCCAALAQDARTGTPGVEIGVQLAEDCSRRLSLGEDARPALAGLRAAARGAVLPPACR